MNGKVVNVSGAEMDAVLSKGGLVLFDLWSPGCQPCRMLMPILDDLAADFADDVAICKIDVEAEDALRDRLAVRALPTLVLCRNGKELDRLVGLQSRSRLTAWIEAYL